MKTFFWLFKIRIECLIANYFLSRSSSRNVHAVKSGTGQADCSLKKFSFPVSVKFLINNFVIRRTTEQSLRIFKQTTVLSLRRQTL